MNEVDPNASGDIMFPNFLCLMSKKFSENNAEDEIREAFRVFDSVSFNVLSIYSLSMLYARGIEICSRLSRSNTARGSSTVL